MTDAERLEEIRRKCAVARSQAKRLGIDLPVSVGDAEWMVKRIAELEAEPELYYNRGETIYTLQELRHKAALRQLTVSMVEDQMFRRKLFIDSGAGTPGQRMRYRRDRAIMKEWLKEKDKCRQGFKS